MTTLEKYKELEIFILNDIINEFFGCDSAYYGVDGLCLAKFIVEKGFRNIGNEISNSGLKCFKKIYKRMKKNKRCKKYEY